MTAAEAALREFVRAAGGSVSFEEFMRWTLYDPVHGYYSRRVRTVGRGGDFSTAATLGMALAGAVARWAAHYRARGTWHLIELGGGSGELAAGVLGRLGWWARRGLRYHVVEVSEGLKAAQHERLARWSGRVRWHRTAAAALEEARGEALIFSNEFVDAFPCARWVRSDGKWRELRVGWPPGDLVGGVVADAVAGDWPEGQRVEVFLSYRRWLSENLAGWRRGRLLTVDYGDELPALYHRRPRGTLRAYCRQLRFEGHEVYARPGQQDLTADVNFTDLQRWGRELGLRVESYGTQASFLRRWLPGATGPMLDPDGAGGAFKVLEQVPAAQPAA